MVSAIAYIRGQGIRGTVIFCPREDGTLVAADICGLPESESNFFAIHIHGGADCGGVDFADTGTHFNPGGVPHPQHAGDLPPLLSCDGEAHMQVLTDRFSPEEVIGKTVVIHAAPDDFHTQPAGNSGKKIACGVIYRFYG